MFRAPGISVHAFHGNSKRERERALERVRCRDGVLLTTYGMVVTSWEQLGSKDGRDFFWVRGLVSSLCYGYMLTGKMIHLVYLYDASSSTVMATIPPISH